MANKDFCDGAMDPIGSIPSGYKGTGGGVYDGEEESPFSGYKRTNSPDGVPELTYDKNAPGVKPPSIGKDGGS